MNKISLLILVAFISISATVVTNKVTYSPAKPIATDTFITEGSASLLDMKEYIIQKQRQGFIVKSVSFSVGSRSAGGIVIVEKYQP